MQALSEQTTRIAAVDIGSNTVHMVVMACGPTVTDLTLLARQVELVRLGADVAAHGAIGEERAALTEEALRAMAAQAQQLGATTILGLATEGVRAARNASAMLERFAAALGAPIALLSGLEEAALTFWGATSDLGPTDEPVAVGDLGGGSCELVVGRGAAIAWARSIPLGSGRLIDEIHPADPPTPEDFARLAELAHGQLATLPPPVPSPSRLLAVGGTATSLTRLTHGDDQPRQLAGADLDRAIAQLGLQPLSHTAAQARIDVERVRLLVGGVVAWRAIVTWLGLPALQVSWRGVREGAIIAWRQAGDAWQRFAAHAVTGAA